LIYINGSLFFVTADDSEGSEQYHANGEPPTNTIPLRSEPETPENGENDQPNGLLDATYVPT